MKTIKLCCGLWVALLTNFTAIPVCCTQEIKSVCEWVKTGEKSIAYGDFRLEKVGTFDTHVDGQLVEHLWFRLRRDCWETTPGKDIWVYLKRNKTCTRHGWGMTWEPVTELNIPIPLPVLPGREYSRTWTQIDNDKKDRAHMRCRADVRYRFEPPLPRNKLRGVGAQEQEDPFVMFTHENLRNDFENSDVTFDGKAFAFDSAIRLDQVELGQHELVVASADSSITLIVTVRPSYVINFIRSTYDVVPIAVMSFTNLSPEPVFVDLQAKSLMLGLELDIYDNVRYVPSGSSVVFLVEFYTATGFLAVQGQTLLAMVEGHELSDGSVLASALASAEVPPDFIRGDSNQDGTVDIADALYSLGYLFLGGATPPCFDSADANDDGSFDISDAMLTLFFLFVGGIDIPAPGPYFCADDPTPDDFHLCNYDPANCGGG